MKNICPYNVLPNFRPKSAIPAIVAWSIFQKFIFSKNDPNLRGKIEDRQKFLTKKIEEISAPKKTIFKKYISYILFFTFWRMPGFVGAIAALTTTWFRIFLRDLVLDILRFSKVIAQIQCKTIDNLSLLHMYILIWNNYLVNNLAWQIQIHRFLQEFWWM